MAYEIVRRAKEIIFSMEGKYTSVNPDDNGALSIGACQWHGNRAKALLQTIVAELFKRYQMPISTTPLLKEITSKTSWASRTLTSFEKDYIKTLLSFKEGYEAQDKLADKDIQNYINHIATLGFADEETLIFLADIENQDGAGASSRIAKQAIKSFGEDATLDDVMETALNDKVFKNYQDRRKKVYKALTGRSYKADDNKTVDYYTVKKGDNLTVIAKQTGTTVNTIVHDNMIKDPDIIHEGQRLKIIK
jgi:LysM repeat protein